MKLKHKLIKEFQYLGEDKKIIVLKVGTILEEYVYKLKSELIPIDKDIVDSNPDFFEIVEWRAELLSYLKSNKNNGFLPSYSSVICCAITLTRSSIFLAGIKGSKFLS